jgi:alanyl-tRNA synthetase
VSTTERLYWQDPYLLEFDAVVTGRREHQGRPAVVLDRTAFYAESGGQPWDTGTLEGVRVTAVVEDGEAILHVLDASLAAQGVHGRVDGERRRDHRQQHHGQHLLSQALVERYGANTISFHLGGEACSIDLDREIDAGQLVSAETRTNEVVWDARPVVVRTVPRSEALGLGLDPSEHVGPLVRLIEVKDFDVRPCGGTHPRSTSEVGMVLALGLERYKGGSRVHFVCGHRALRLVRARHQVLDLLAATLSAGIAELPDAAQKAVERLAAADRRNRELTEWALEGEARRLLAENPGTPAIVARAFDGWAPQDLRTLAIKLTRLGSCVALLGSRAEKAHLVFAQSEGLPHGVAALLKDALALVGGRGGGRGNLVQGGGERLDALDEALARAAQATAKR